jgi:hypothetical protein
MYDDKSEISPVRIKRNRREKSKCPFCNTRINTTGNGGRRKLICDHCRAQIAKDESSPCCAKSKVWSYNAEFRCFTCGKVVRDA